MKGILLFIFILAVACGTVVEDNLNAFEAQDPTVALKVDGCGHQWIPGYAMCKVKAGSVANRRLYIANIKANCDEDACVSYKIYHPNGDVAFGGTIPNNEPYASIPWVSLIKKDHFQKGDRGFWGVIIEVKWKDAEDRERTAIGEGEIRLRVYDEKYIPLEESENDPRFVFSQKIDGQTIKYTTGLRTYISRN